MRMEYVIVSIVLALIVLLVAFTILSGLPPAFDQIFGRIGG